MGVTLPKPVRSSTKEVGVNDAWQPKPRPLSGQSETQVMWLSTYYAPGAGLGPHIPAAPLHPHRNPTR